MTPFILKGCNRLCAESAPTTDQIYDEYLQLWINRTSKVPIVIEMQRRIEASKFGETTITETREGADQSEVSSLIASQFGETTETRMPAEGTDQPITVHALSSQFGETTMTKAHGEGADAEMLSSQFGETSRTFSQGEGIDEPPMGNPLASQFGETTLKKNGEGSDQCEVVLFDELMMRSQA
jgi:hypothetical protein